MTLLKRLARDRSGATAVEYGLIVVLILVASMTMISAVGTDAVNTYRAVDNAIKASFDRAGIILPP